MMEFKWVEKYYQDEHFNNYMLKNISFKINEGEFVSIMRPSGNSKSDLMYLFGSLNIESDGDYVFYDQSNIEDKGDQISDLNNPHIGFILKRNCLAGKLTVYENIEAPLIHQNLQSSERRKRVDKILKEFNLFSAKGFFPSQLSRYKLLVASIARAVVRSPKLIIADDPCSNLNLIQSNQILEILTKLNQNGITILLATSSSKLISRDAKVINLFEKHLVNDIPERTIN